MSNPKLLDYFETKIKALLNKKVDKVPGKGLSTEDYTTAEKTKLAGIPSGGGSITVDSAMSSTSENPVQNKVIYTALGNKVDKVTGKGLSTEDFTTAEKTKLAGLDPNPMMIDSELDATSTDPVQNKAITAAINSVLPVGVSIATRESCHTSLSYSGVYVEIPAKSFFCITATAVFNNASPVQITINTSPTNANLQLANDVRNVTYCGYCASQSSFYIWVQYSAESQNDIRVSGFYIKNSL